MKIKQTIFFITIFTISTIIPQAVSVHAEGFLATIGTGGITGVYYPAGGAIARTLNKTKTEHNIRVIAEPSGGSVFNINAIMAGTFQFGIVQSDSQHNAVSGLADWLESGPQTDLRSVFSLHQEAVTLIAAADANINGIEDLRAKRVNLGNPGSGNYRNAIDALSGIGLNHITDISASTINALDAPGALQENRIDAFFYTVGHPSSAIKEATSGLRKVKIINISDIDELLMRYRFYSPATIPIKLYPDALNRNDVKTFGVRATLVTSIHVPDNIVYTITKSIFEDLNSFKKLHPALDNLSRESMLQSLSAPIHPGAIRYYKEAGLL